MIEMTKFVSKYPSLWHITSDEATTTHGFHFDCDRHQLLDLFHSEDVAAGDSHFLHFLNFENHFQSADTPEVPVPSPPVKTEDHTNQETMIETKNEILPPVASENVLTFYYGWYGNPKTNQKYFHWNHEVLVGKDDPRHKFYSPPEDIGADFYPEMGNMDMNVF